MHRLAIWLLSLPIPDPELACEAAVWACLLFTLSHWRPTMIRLLRDRRGVSSLEYAVLAVAVVGVVAAAVTLVLGPAITAAFNDVASAISAAMTTAKGT